MGAHFHHGDAVMVDHTPGSDVVAGQMLALGAKVVVAHSAIVAGEKGHVSYPGGQAAYLVTLAAGDSFSPGDPVTVDLGSQETNGAIGTAFGVCIEAANQAAGDTQVYAMQDN